MKAFFSALAERNSYVRTPSRRWIYCPYDQLHGDLGPLGREDPASLGLVLVESPKKAARRPYHRQKLALILANQRHFALEQAERGVAVRYRVDSSDEGYASALSDASAELGPLEVMRPAERELRAELAQLFRDGQLRETPHEGWLTGFDSFWKTRRKDGSFFMDSFYRRIRKETGYLMEGKDPLGGKWSFDDQNRKPWKGDPAPAHPPKFEVDEITAEVGALIESEFSAHPGRLDLEALPVTRADAEFLWEWAKKDCLESFGPYEDAMTVESTTLFHTRVSAHLNIHRLLPAQVIADTLGMDIPINSKEGLLRQVIGWREFVHHVHEATDGFRREAAAPKPIEVWASEEPEIDPGSNVSELGSHESLPPAYWEEVSSGLNCLDTVVDSVWDEAYSHHITRLMVLANLGTLLDLSPRELTDWFWVAYTDAFDWVVEPNVLAMGTFATGPLMTTKPYVSGAAYINKMSDYCSSCRFHPKKDCPVTPLYWAFLARHEEILSGNPRMGLVMKSLAKRDGERRAEDRRAFETVRRQLAAGETVNLD